MTSAAAESPEYLTVKQAAARLGLSRSRVYELCASGLLSHVRVGAGTIRISPDHLAQFVRQHTRGPAPAPAPAA